MVKPTYTTVIENDRNYPLENLLKIVQNLEQVLK